MSLATDERKKMECFPSHLFRRNGIGHLTSEFRQKDALNEAMASKCKHTFVLRHGNTFGGEN